MRRNRLIAVLGSLFVTASVFALASITHSPVMPVADAGPDGSTAICNSGIGPVCGDDGGPGCGGNGGNPGAGGQGGGASIALYVTGNSHVTMINGAFFVGYGGTGGSGGSGGVGASGQTGQPGAQATCYLGCDAGSCTFDNPTLLSGGGGGLGGTGGTAGNGGGGAGGPIYFYVATPPATVTLQNSAFTLGASLFKGSPGTGGPPNGPDAPDAAISGP